MSGDGNLGEVPHFYVEVSREPDGTPSPGANRLARTPLVPQAKLGQGRGTPGRLQESFDQFHYDQKRRYRFAILPGLLVPDRDDDRVANRRADQ